MSSGNALPGSLTGGHVMPSRSVPRPMPMVGMQRMQPQGMANPYNNLSSQPGMNPGSIPMQRGLSAQAHQQQQQQVHFFSFITFFDSLWRFSSYLSDGHLLSGNS